MPESTALLIMSGRESLFSCILSQFGNRTLIAPAPPRTERIAALACSSLDKFELKVFGAYPDSIFAAVVSVFCHTHLSSSNVRTAAPDAISLLLTPSALGYALT